MDSACRSAMPHAQPGRSCREEPRTSAITSARRRPRSRCRRRLGLQRRSQSRSRGEINCEPHRQSSTRRACGTCGWRVSAIQGPVGSATCALSTGPAGSTGHARAVACPWCPAQAVTGHERPSGPGARGPGEPVPGEPACWPRDPPACGGTRRAAAREVRRHARAAERDVRRHVTRCDRKATVHGRGRRPTGTASPGPRSGSPCGTLPGRGRGRATSRRARARGTARRWRRRRRAGPAFPGTPPTGNRPWPRWG
jgi:hypothetical protein